MTLLSSVDAFGENGRPASGEEGVVPPNSSLQINLELISWKAVSDITEDKKVLKKTLKEGEKCERPNDGSVVQGKALAVTEVSIYHIQKQCFALFFCFAKFGCLCR